MKYIETKLPIEKARKHSLTHIEMNKHVWPRHGYFNDLGKYVHICEK